MRMGIRLLRLLIASTSAWQVVFVEYAAHVYMSGPLQRFQPLLHLHRARTTAAGQPTAAWTSRRIGLAPATRSRCSRYVFVAALVATLSTSVHAL